MGPRQSALTNGIELWLGRETTRTKEWKEKESAYGFYRDHVRTFPPRSLANVDDIDVCVAPMVHRRVHSTSASLNIVMDWLAAILDQEQATLQNLARNLTLELARCSLGSFVGAAGEITSFAVPSTVNRAADIYIPT